MRLTIKGTGLIDCEGTIKSLGKEKYRENYNKKSVLAHAKLGQLEDIEDEFGIDLVTLLKAVKNGVWCKHCDGLSIEYCPFRIDYWIDYKTGEEGMYICGMNIKDYGKTWALTKEELTNE